MLWNFRLPAIGSEVATACAQLDEPAPGLAAHIHLENNMLLRKVKAALSQQ